MPAPAPMSVCSSGVTRLGAAAAAGAISRSSTRASAGDCCGCRRRSCCSRVPAAVARYHRGVAAAGRHVRDRVMRIPAGAAASACCFPAPDPRRHVGALARCAAAAAALAGAAPRRGAEQRRARLARDPAAAVRCCGCRPGRSGAARRPWGFGTGPQRRRQDDHSSMRNDRSRFTRLRSVQLRCPLQPCQLRQWFLRRLRRFPRSGNASSVERAVTTRCTFGQF